MPRIPAAGLRHTTVHDKGQTTRPKAIQAALERARTAIFSLTQRETGHATLAFESVCSVLSQISTVLLDNAKAGFCRVL